MSKKKKMKREAALFSMGDVHELLPFQIHSMTSREAAVSMKNHAANLRERVYQSIKLSMAGMTAEEVTRYTGIKGDTVRPRIVELSRDGRIEVAGKRKTMSGRNADVWVAK